MAINSFTDYTVPAEIAGFRLDKAISTLTKVPRSTALALVSAGALVDGTVQPTKYHVRLGQVISLPDLIVTAEVLQTVPGLEIVYEDEYCLIVDKPAGVIVHPARHFAEPSLAGFARTVSSDPDTLRPGIVHRLDRGTSGLVIIAKTEAAKLQLQKLFSSRAVNKTYYALVHGAPKEATALLEWPIGRHPKRPTQRTVRPDGKPSATRYSAAEYLPGYTLLELQPETGRTHQIRVHLAKLGHPVVGDTVYGVGRPTLGLDRLFLHAGQIEFASPGGVQIKAVAALPQQLVTLLAAIRDGHV